MTIRSTSHRTHFAPRRQRLTHTATRTSVDSTRRRSSSRWMARHPRAMPPNGSPHGARRGRRRAAWCRKAGICYPRTEVPFQPGLFTRARSDPIHRALSTAKRLQTVIDNPGHDSVAGIGTPPTDVAGWRSAPRWGHDKAQEKTTSLHRPRRACRGRDPGERIGTSDGSSVRPPNTGSAVTVPVRRHSHSRATGATYPSQRSTPGSG